MLSKFIRIVFLLLTLLIFYSYFGMLLEKSNKPNLKNLSYESYAWLGVIVLGLIVADFFIIKGFFKK